MALGSKTNKKTKSEYSIIGDKMTIVNNQTELQNALSTSETEIQIASNFEIATAIPIRYTVSIHSTPNSTFTLLKSASFFGNILRIENGGSLTLSNIILDGNKENHPTENITNRALILLSGGTLILQENSIIQNNITYLEGGGVYLSGSPSYANHLIMEDNAIIRGCDARTNGGGIIAAIRNQADTLVIRNQATIENNTANYGGGLYYRIYTENVGSSITLYDSPIFQNNTANNSGGAMAFFNINNNTENIEVHLTGTLKLSNNKSINHGGGIYFVGTHPNDQLDIEGAMIQENQVGGYGGGIYTSNTPITLQNTTITQNTAGTGGGLYILSTSGGTLQMENSAILYNQSTNGDSGSGGGIWLNNRSTTTPYTFQIRDSSIANNSASASGGGIYVSERAQGLTTLIENVDIKSNIAKLNGAGLLLASAGTGSVRILNSVIQDNHSGNYGGGLYLSNENVGITTTSITQSTITNNLAEVQGGGLRLAAGQGTSNIIIEDCSIERNIAHSNSGGGLWCGGDHINVSLLKTTTVNQNESTEGNGGGIYFNSQNGILTLSDNIKITNNLASENPNMTRNHGGGICLVPGTLLMNGNSEISGNKARNGGGISSRDGSTLTIESGSIHDNEALLGGGIHNLYSTIYFKGGSLYKNRASIGGGIYHQT